MITHTLWYHSFCSIIVIWYHSFYHILDCDIVIKHLWWSCFQILHYAARALHCPCLALAPVLQGRRILGQNTLLIDYKPRAVTSTRESVGLGCLLLVVGCSAAGAGSFALTAGCLQGQLVACKQVFGPHCIIPWACTWCMTSSMVAEAWEGRKLGAQDTFWKLINLKQNNWMNH